MADRNHKHAASGTSLAAAGGVTAGAGLAAGGIPGAKSDFTAVFRTKPAEGKGVKRAVSHVKGKAPLVRAAPGGVLGFRIHAHEGGTVGFEQQAEQLARRTSAPEKAAHHAFSHGYTEGKIEPEKQVLRHMRGGRKVAAGALIGGAGLTAYGVHRAKEEREQIRKDRRSSDKYNGALAGTGAAGFTLGHGGHKLFRGQERKWTNRANTNVDEAQKLVPGLGGRKHNQNLRAYKKHLARGGTPENFPKTMEPERHMTDILRDKKVFAGVHPDVARKAGNLRGAAVQAEHFSHVYGNTGKVVGRLRTPSAIVGGAGVGGLVAAHRHEDKVHKARNLSQTEIDRRKKAGATLTRTTSAIGLGSLALVGAGAAAPRLARSGRLARIAPKMTEEKALAFREKTKNKAITAGIVSQGVGGFNGFNNAAWQNAEARQRKKPITKSAPSPFEDGFYGSEGNWVDMEEVSKVSHKTKFMTGFHQGNLEQGHLERIKSKSYRTGEKVGFSVRRASQTLNKLPIKKSDELSAFGVVHD